MATAGRILFFVEAWLVNRILEKGYTSKNLFCNWDCGWYLSIINKGYDLAPHAHSAGDAANWAFFPLYPLIVRLFVFLFDGTPEMTGAILSNISFIGGIVLLGLYVREILDEYTALLTSALLCFSPWSIYFSMQYTESLYFLLTIATVKLMYRGKYIWCGIIGSLLTATRSLGVFIVIPVFLWGVKRIGIKNTMLLKEGGDSLILSILLIPIGLAFFMIYLYCHVGDALAFSHIQIAWGRSIGNPFLNLYSGLMSGVWPDEYFAIISVIALFLILPLVLKSLYMECFQIVITVIIPVSTGLISMPRFVFTLYPVYMSLALLLRFNKVLQLMTLLLFTSLSPLFVVCWLTGKSFMV